MVRLSSGVQIRFVLLGFGGGSWNSGNIFLEAKMLGTTKAKRKPVVKPQIERSVESLLWRIANQRYSRVIVGAILSGAILVGAFLCYMITAWVM